MMCRSWRYLGALMLTIPLVAHGDALGRRGLMGVQLAPVASPHDGQESAGSGGVLVAGVFPGTAAEKAGLKPNDVIVGLDGAAITDFNDLLTRLRKYRAGDTLKLELVHDGEKRTADLTLGERPRETSDEFEIIYDSAGEKGKRVRTYVVRPKQEGRYPAILFMQSLPPFPIEFASRGGPVRHPFKLFLDDLTRAGFVTMRVERPGIGDSEGGDPRMLTPKDDIEAFTRAVEKLRAYDFVDKSNVFVFAHSGGTIWAPYVAKNADIRGVVTYAAVARPIVDAFLRLSRRTWELDMLPDDEIKTKSDQLSKLLTACFVHKQAPAKIRESHGELGDLIGEMFQEDQYFGGLHFGYYQQLADMDLKDAWRQVKAPVLAVFGEADFRADRLDSELVAKVAGGGGEVTVLNQTDHSFFKAEDAEESYLSGGAGGEYNASVSKAVVDWLKKHVKESDA